MVSASSMDHSSGLLQLPSSSINVASITGHHLLKINGYSLINKMVPYGDHIKSYTFQAAGYNWHINYYPNGCDSLIFRNAHEYVSLQIILDGTVPEAVKAQFTLSLLNCAGLPVPATVHRSPVHDLAGGWWFLNLIRKADLEQTELRLLRNDSFTIRFDVLVLDKSRVEVKAPFVVVPPHDLHQDLEELLYSEDGADVTLEAGGQKFNAHRCVLAARSPVLKAKLLGPMKEGTSNCTIHIEDMEAQVFKAMLQFMYTDSLPEINKQEEVAMWQHLLEAADRFNLQRLKLMCEDKLCMHIDTSSVAITLALAEQHNCLGLKEKCFEFLKTTNVNAAMAADGFNHLARSCPTILEELMSMLPLH